MAPRDDRTMLHITLNGKPHSLPQPVAADVLVAQLGLVANQVAIERNREIVPRSRWGETVLSDGDQIEIVQFIGGG